MAVEAANRAISPAILEKFNKIPPELQKGSYFCPWKYGRPDKNGKRPKIPYNATKYLKYGRFVKKEEDGIGSGASSSDPSTWASWEDALYCYQVVNQRSKFFDGIGIMLDRESGRVGMDLDHIIKDGVLDPVAQELARLFQTWWYVTPGKDGARAIFYGSVPDGFTTRPVYKGLKLELYCDVRFLTLTNDQLEGSTNDIADCQAALDDFVKAVGYSLEDENTSGGCVVVVGSSLQATKQTRPQKTTAPAAVVAAPYALEALSLEDQAIYTRAAENPTSGDDFRTLWNGGIPESAINGRKNNGSADESVGDFHLILRLLYWTNDDMQQTERLFKASKRYREKTDSRRKTIADPLDKTQRITCTSLQYDIRKAVATRHHYKKPGPVAKAPAPKPLPMPTEQKIVYPWMLRSETEEERHELLKSKALEVKQLVLDHIKSGSSTVQVVCVAPGVGKSHATSEIGNEGYSIGWIAQRHNMIESVKALQYYIHIQAANKDTCPMAWSLDLELGSKGYNTRPVHVGHVCEKIAQHERPGSKVYQIPHLRTGYPAKHDGMIVDELDIASWLQENEKEFTVQKIQKAARSYHVESYASLLLVYIEAVISDQAEKKDYADLHGKSLFDAINEKCGGRLEAWLSALSQEEKYTNTHPYYKLEETNEYTRDYEVKSLPPVVLPHIVVAMLKELLNWKSGKQWNSCVRIGFGPHGHALFIAQPLTFTAGSDGQLPPVSILDATADETLLSLLLARPVLVQKKEVDPPPGTRHIAIRTGKRYGKYSLCGKRQEDIGQPKKIAKDLRRTIKEARHILKQHDPDGSIAQAGEIGIVSFMSCVDQLGEALGIPAARQLYFGAARGSNKLKDCKILLVVGTFQVSPDALLRLARILWRNDPLAIDPHSEKDQEGIWRYTDPRLEKLNNYLTFAEMTQCAHRSRALRYERTVISFCAAWVEIGDLPVTTLINDLPQLDEAGEVVKDLNTAENLAKLDQAVEELLQSGKTLEMVTVRELVGAVGKIDRTFVVEYLRNKKSAINVLEKANNNNITIGFSQNINEVFLQSEEKTTTTHTPSVLIEPAPEAVPTTEIVQSAGSEHVDQAGHEQQKTKYTFTDSQTGKTVYVGYSTPELIEIWTRELQEEGQRKYDAMIREGLNKRYGIRGTVAS